MRIRTKLAAAAAAAALAAGGLALAAAPAMAAPACTVNCTNGTVNVGSTIGTTGFPTSFSMTGNAGSTATATATPYSVYSNTAWTLNFESDASDLQGGGGFPAYWYIAGTVGLTDAFPIYSSTTITHGGTPYNLPAGNGVTSVQIDSGGATAGGQNFADVFSVAIPQAQPPGQYVATFAYVLAG